MMLKDRKFRLARIWSNQELRKIAPQFEGDIVNVSAWDDRDKEGQYYREYFVNARSYSYTNYGGVRGSTGKENEYQLDLAGEIPKELFKRFDVAYNHTVLEHIFDVHRAFANLCMLSKDVVIVVVPFAQSQHESESYGDYWRFTPTCLRQLFSTNGFSVIYEAESPYSNAAVYILFVASRNPERWVQKLPPYKKIAVAGSWIGRNLWFERLKWGVQELSRMIKK